MVGYDCFFFASIQELGKYLNFLANPFTNKLPYFHLAMNFVVFQNILNLRSLYGRKGIEIVAEVDKALKVVDPLEGLGQGKFKDPTPGNFHYWLRKLRRMAVIHPSYLFYGS
eukprot:Phypoly_transcript_28858.p1 GENE.Phypoly_transcript_28858~~Phypoly_transcript_28858.p1  ORF type:complete len:112 (+),score=10.51 Phypoly_transcript_28858:84-419(+)